MSEKNVNIAMIGLGGRGAGHLDYILKYQPDVTILGVCDLYEDRAEDARKMVLERRGNDPVCTTDSDKIFEIPGLDAVVIATSWKDHVPLCITAMKKGIRPGVEVAGAYSIDQLWQLVHTYEETKVPVMFLENCCYGREELMLLNMVRQGAFGTLVHLEGAYHHDLCGEITEGRENRHYRLRNYLTRNCENYPTHELGPIAEYLNINRGNRMVSLVSMASKASGLHAWFAENRSDSPLCEAQVNEGDVVTTLIKCANGETIRLVHDCTLPRPYSRGGEIHGTKGLWMEDKRSIYLEGVSEKPHRWESDEEYMKKYKHPLWEEYEQFGLRGGHGGMDYLVLRAFVESVQDNVKPPIDTYDMASWMAVTALSEMSIAAGSSAVPFPDFTNGRWIEPRDDENKGEYAL